MAASPLLWSVAVSPKLRYRPTAMHFPHIVQDYVGYLSPYEVLSHRRETGSGLCPTINLTIASNKNFHRLLWTFIFSWAPGLNLLLAFSWCQYSLLSVTPKTCILSSEIYRYTSCLKLHCITTSGFERDHDAILVRPKFLIWRRHVPRDVVSHFIEFMDT